MIGLAYVLMAASLLIALEALFKKGFTWTYVALALLIAAVVLVVLSMGGY